MINNKGSLLGQVGEKWLSSSWVVSFDTQSIISKTVNLCNHHDCTKYCGTHHISWFYIPEIKLEFWSQWPQNLKVLFLFAQFQRLNVYCSVMYRKPGSNDYSLRIYPYSNLGFNFIQILWYINNLIAFQ